MFSTIPQQSMTSINAGIDNALKMNQMFKSCGYWTKLLIEPFTIALEIRLSADKSILYLFNDDGTYKSYKDVWVR